MHARERRAVRMFIRRDTYARYVSVLVYLPRDRYNTTVRERFAQILRSGWARSPSSSPCSIDESTTARVHFVVHLPKGESIPEIDIPDLERRLAEASRSWRDDFTSAVIAEYGEETGADARPPLPRLLPRGLQGGLRAPHRGGRPRPAGGDRGRRGHRPLALPGPRRRERARPG